MINIEETKQKLQQEKERLLTELNEIGGGHNLGSEEVSPNEITEVDSADELPDRMEELEENEANEENLKALLKQTDLALTKIMEGTYGVCDICEQPIEEERLQANISATTCIAHR